MCLDNAWATKAAIHDAAGIKDPWNASDVSVPCWALQGRPCQDLDSPRVALDAEIHADSLPPAEEELQPKGFFGRAWDQLFGILSLDL
ncbi:unnamed protein product, partial [Cladocopium goreaui]